MSAKHCVLAYSGGLDTSAIVPWLIDQGYVVHAVLVDVGQSEDLPALREKALSLGSETAVVRDAKPEIFEKVVPYALGLGATYEGVYRLGTALTRPFIALEQIRRARELGGGTLIHGATGKGNDQVRFEYAYRSLAPDYPVLAPWKSWEFGGRQDLIDYLANKGLEGDYEVIKDYSLDENFWHLSVEGGVLEDPTSTLEVDRVLASVADRFGGNAHAKPPSKTLEIKIEEGLPVSINGESVAPDRTIARLNSDYRHEPWSWDLVIENRFTGVKSRGLYINPAAKLLHIAVDALSRSCLNKPTFDYYVNLGHQYAAMLYRGEYFSDQRMILESAARAVMRSLNGDVTVNLSPTPYVSRINADRPLFCEEIATFEKSDFSHQDAQGFIRLSWQSAVGQPFSEAENESAMEPNARPASEVCRDQSVSGAGLVSSAL
ncbi:MAG: argininosuccinate synthase [Phycisphaerales bacterium]|nr:argininosuccinate synthase [Phycisphaerales bacterium]